LLLLLLLLLSRWDVSVFYSQLCYVNRGLFLAALVHHEGRILVSGDDTLPMIDVDSEFSSLTLNSDLFWLMKVTNRTVCLCQLLCRMSATIVYSTYLATFNTCSYRVAQKSKPLSKIIIVLQTAGAATFLNQF